MKKYIIVSLFIGMIGLGAYIYRIEHRDPVFEAFFFHLNRGRSIFLRTPQGKTILIDGGQNSEVIRELTRVTPFYKRRIDLLIVTSSLPKNVGGLIEVLDRYEVGKVLIPSIMGTSTAFSAFEKQLEKKSLIPERVSRGDTFAIDGVDFRIVFPDPDFKFNKTSLPELVLQVDYHSKALVFLGDVSVTIQKSLIKDFEKIYLVEYAHGATKSRVSADFVSKLEPKIIISTKREETVRYEFR